MTNAERRALTRWFDRLASCLMDEIDAIAIIERIESGETVPEPERAIVRRYVGEARRNHGKVHESLSEIRAGLGLTRN